MALQAVAGSKIYIGTRVARKATVALADFTAQEAEWTEIAGWTQSGALGETQNLISQDFISEDRTNHIKGTKSGNAFENTFAPRPSDAGQIKMDAAVEDCNNYAFKIEWGAGCASEGTVTISVADPGVVTWAGGHGLEAGSPVIFTPTGGNLPTGLSEDTVYYVVDDSNLTPTTFAVSATQGGTAIETTGAATATSITATAQPAGTTRLFYGLVMPGSDQGGAANTPLLQTYSIQPNSNILKV